MYSALHALSLSLLDKFHSSASNPTIVTTTSPASPDPAPVPIFNPVPTDDVANPSISADNLKELRTCSESTKLRIEDLDRAQQLLSEELKVARDTISALQGKIGSFHETMSSVTADVGSVQEGSFLLQDPT